MQIDTQHIEEENLAFLARQPIMRPDGSLVAYELSLSPTRHRLPSSLSACYGIISSIQEELAVEWLFQDKLAFVKVLEADLKHPSLLDLPGGRLILELDSTILPTPEVLERCATLKAHGHAFAIGLLPAFGPGHELLKHCAYLKADIGTLNPEIAHKAVVALSAAGIQCIAEGIRDEAQSAWAREIGFPLLQGYFFLKSPHAPGHHIGPSSAVIIEMMSLVGKNADLRLLEACLRKDIPLSFRLLKHINSAGYGLSCEISSIRHALTIVGYSQLYRWLSLLLATSIGENTRPVAAHNAITRGRLCELLGSMYLEGKDLDNLFIVGVFSMLDTLMGIPMESALADIALPENVGQAILLDEGVYAPFLRLAIACERDEKNGLQMEDQAEGLMIESSIINRCHMQALAWTEGLGI